VTAGRAARRRQGTRDQTPSEFTNILDRLLRSVAGGRAAAMVDYEGETVDYAGAFDAFDIKVAAAHWQLVWGEINDETRIGPLCQLIVRARKQSYIVRRIHPSYLLVIVLHPRAAFAASARAVEEAERLLCAEAEFDAPKVQLRWYGVDVRTAKAARSRPLSVRVGARWEPVEVIGAIVGLGRREKGFRVRLSGGVELLLVRERFGAWFADEQHGE
jgi:hypothetical protein